ncbi:hypothetical protein EC839_1093 [Pseudomonas sp. JUb52]|nr:hypothetical protein EC839_1093 [Pseudomonas sp. JUb52]
MKKLDLIIDTNLLLLLVIGFLDNGNFIKKSKRLNEYDEFDYHATLTVMQDNHIHITPYIATEVSNLIDLSGEAQTRAFEFSRILFSEFTEIKTDLNEDVKSEFFPYYGLTDSSLISLVSNYNILTHDRRLTPILYHCKGENVIDFEVLRVATRT